MHKLHISLAAEELFKFLGISVTNSLLTTLVIAAGLVLLLFIASRKFTSVPHRFQGLLELIVESLLGIFSSLLGPQKAKKYLPILGTFFIFILVSNWSGLIPGVGPIGIYEHADKLNPLFRAPTSDLNTTLALAFIAVYFVQYAGIKEQGTHYLRKFINFKSPINFFVGILEIISELSKLMSFSFRLFGNVFAGEVLLVVITFLVSPLLPIPFLGMEIFVGFIQALVFTMLTTTFLSMAISSESHA